ncbi:MAG TPA: hypothetical protein VFW68_14170 [Rhodocyclaceae bacterium]|nr:hypothetical protein [Rhodocyclaceae bacterium]
MPTMPPFAKVLSICGLALMFMCPVSAVMAADSDSAMPAAPSSQSSAGNGEVSAIGVSILSGGVGLDGQEEMRRAAKSYNVHVLFASRQGAYLADIPFTVTDHKGRQVAASTSEGPWLYLKLPPGSYQISASLHGASQMRKVKVGVGAAPMSVNFLFPDQ